MQATEKERIAGSDVILSRSKWPESNVRRLIINESDGSQKSYQLRRTKKGCYIIN